MSGFTHLTGEPNGPPQHMNYPLGDAIAGLFGAFAIATALAERNAQPREQQKGVEIDLSATEAMLRLLDPLAAEYRFNGVARGRTGSRAGYTAPSNVYRTADGEWITLVGSGEAIFRRLCKAMEREELASDPRFDSNVHRTENLEVLDAMVAQWCGSLDLAVLAQRLDREEVPFTKVYSIADVVKDPHFRARGAVIEMQDPVLGAVPGMGVVPRFVGRVGAVPTVGPETGRDNEEVYGELGLTHGDLANLGGQRVI